MNTSFHDIEGFLSHKRLALVGASLNPKDFSRALMRELGEAGYEIVPVNRRAGADASIEGRRGFAHVGDIAAVEGPVDGALLMVPPSQAAEVVRECLAAGVTRLWFHRGAGRGAVDDEAVRVAREAGALTVVGECPLMYLPGAKLVHRVHGGLAHDRSQPRLSGLATPRPGTGLVVLLALLQALVGLPALGGGGLLVSDPTGGRVGLSLEWLASSPFGSYLVPGLVLFAVGLCHIGAAILTLRRRPIAGRFAMALGLAMMGFIVGQWLWLPQWSWLQPAYFAIGVAEIAAGLTWLAHLAPRVPSLPRGIGQGAARA